MGDSVFDAIDRFYDSIDRVVDVVENGSSRVQHLEERKTAVPRATTLALAPVRFRLIESIDAETGRTAFTVTDGRAARCECDTRATAEKILAALNKDGTP